ncbi:kinase-like protein [Serendipita vermifera]|nr:kinase-like protein [Serendipita vermifera]
MEGKLCPLPSFEPTAFKNFVKREYPHSLNTSSDSTWPYLPAASLHNDEDGDQIMGGPEINEVMHKTSASVIRYIWTIKTDVAIYTIDGKPAVAKRLRSRWELEVLKELHNVRAKNIVPLITIAQENSPRPLIVMENFVEIVDWPVSLDECFSFGHQLADTIMFIHSRLICHLDIKPHNLVINEATRELFLIDFGLSVRLSDKEARIKGARGTPGWTAPELNIDPLCTKTTLGSWEVELDDSIVFSAVLADTWAVGKVIHWLTTRPSGWEKRLELLGGIATKLMHDIPALRLDLGTACSEIMHAETSSIDGMTEDSLRNTVLV